MEKKWRGLIHLMDNLKSQEKGKAPSRRAQSGQSAMIAIGMTILISLVLAGTTLSKLSATNATRNIVTKQSLQTYYVAQAGLQEALATRMVPRTNYLAYRGTQAFYPNSGNVYRDPINKLGRIGQYRYFILGGQSSRQANGNYYDWSSKNAAGDARLLSTSNIPESSPFIVVSNGSVCRSATNRTTAIEDQIVTGTEATGYIPTCRNGFVKDELTLVALVRLNREDASMDRASQIRTFKSSNNLPLPAATTVPGYAGWRNAGSTIDFETAWKGARIELGRIVFYNFSDNTLAPYKEVPITGTLTQITDKIPAKAVIRLYFDTPLDFRSISATYDKNLKDCQSNVNTCRIRVMQNTNATGVGGTAYSGNVIIPLLPDGSQIILLPPLSPSDQIGANQQNAVIVETANMRSWNGMPGANRYVITFSTL